jgi:hypothetical protein
MDYYAYVLIDKITKENLYVGSGSGKRYQDYGRHNEEMRSWSDIHGVPGAILFPCNSKKEANELEEELILKYGRKDLGTGTLFNKSNGIGQKGNKLTAESMQKQYETKKERGTLKGGRPVGYKMPAEFGKKIAALRTGTKRSEESKKKMSDSAKNRKLKDWNDMSVKTQGRLYYQNDPRVPTGWKP